MLNLRDLWIDPASLGRKMLLVDVMPAYEYKDGKRTETVSGYRYVVCMADKIGASGTYHTHVYLYASSPMRLGTVKKRFPTAHIDKAHGTSQETRDYTCKESKWTDTILSQIILDSTAAAEQIPKDARGRFLLHDGTVFQAYWFDDTAGITSSHA